MSRKTGFVLTESAADAWSGTPKMVGITLDNGIAEAWVKENTNYMIDRSYYEVPIIES